MLIQLQEIKKICEIYQLQNIIVIQKPLKFMDIKLKYINILMAKNRKPKTKTTINHKKLQEQ